MKPTINTPEPFKASGAHTPGPWLMFFDGQLIGVTEDRDKHERVTDEKTAGNVSVEYVPLKTAIAAPDLLEACKKLIEAAKHQEVLRDMIPLTLRLSEDAIKKAQP